MKTIARIIGILIAAYFIYRGVMVILPEKWIRKQSIDVLVTNNHVLNVEFVEPTNWVASGTTNVFVAGEISTNDFNQVVFDAKTGNIFVWVKDEWVEYVKKEKSHSATNHLTH